MQQQEIVEIQQNNAAQGQAGILFATRPNTVAAPAVNAPAPPPYAVDAPPPRYTVHAPARPAVDDTRATASIHDGTATGSDGTATIPDGTATGSDATATDPDAATTVGARTTTARPAGDKDGSDRPRKARRITKKDK
jgi:hypothetical protein